MEQQETLLTTATSLGKLVIPTPGFASLKARSTSVGLIVGRLEVGFEVANCMSGAEVVVLNLSGYWHAGK
jgi:hypothetical protein